MTAADHDPPAVRLVDVGVRYRGDTWAVRHVSAEIPAGAVVAVVGSNGSGKTSLLRAAVGLHPPDEGVVQVCGSAFRPDDVDHLASIAYVGQRKPLYGSFRVAELLRFGRATNPGWDAGYALARIRESGIDPRRRVDQLSGGQRTQVALTLALAKRARVLVLDEPMGDLDPVARHEVFASLMADVAAREATVVLSSHIVGELELTCDRLVLLREGRVILAGELDDVVADHVLLTGPVAGLAALARQVQIVDVEQDQGSVRVLGRTSMDRRFLDPRWQVHPVDMTAVVMGHLQSRRAAEATDPPIRAVS